ncbi:hypothetical protein ACKGJO_13055 [Gracilimonas sp. Q87]|uniref:hypothetical protein n=1 Tax=Gracilimonas sp. Q87 TaxID=3384766 RepID=UPI00398450C5
MGSIEKILEYVGFERLLKFIKELPIFYLKPKSFFKKFFQKDFEEKFLQVLFYIMLLIFLGYFTIENITLREMIKFMIFELASLFTIVLILSVSALTISKFTPVSFSLEKVTFFSILAKILIAPFQIVFFGLFVSFENYNYYFAHNLIVLILYLYIFFYSANIFYSRLRHIVAGISLNLLFLNILIMGISSLSIDDYTTFESPYYVDQIMKERIEKGEPIKNYFKYPTHRVLIKENGKTIPYYTFQVPLDTIASGSIEESLEYRQNIKRNIGVLKSIQDSLKFQRNETFFKKSLSLYQNIDSLLSINYLEYTENDIEKVTVYVEEKSEKELFQEILLPLPDDIESEMYRLAMSQQELNKTSYYSTIPLALVQYFTPVSFLINESSNNSFATNSDNY